MIEHNKRFAAGEETWSQKMHEDMDLTAEEFVAKKAGGLPHYDQDTTFEDTLDARIMKALAEQGERTTAISLGRLANDLSEQHILDCAYNHVVNDASGSW